MTKFGDWLRRAIAPGVENIDQMDYDHANLTAQLEESLEKIRSGEIPEAVKREVLFACLTYKETIAALALRRTEEFKEKYT